MSYERYKDFRLAPDDNGCWDILTADTYEQKGTYPSKAAAKRAIDEMTPQEQPDSQAGDDQAKAKLKFIMDKLIACGMPEAKEVRGKYYPIVPYIEMAKWVDAYAERLATKRAIAAQKALPQPTDESCYNCGQKTFNYDGANRCIYCGGYQTDLERQQLGKEADHADHR